MAVGKSRMRRKRNPNATTKRRRNRIGGTGSKLIEKVYSYRMTPNQNYLIGAQANPGTLSVAPAQFPLGLGFCSQPIASKTSFVNYYDFGVALSFNLTDLANYTSYTGLYDNYKINSINLELEFMKNDSGVVGAGIMPTVYAVVDNDDANVPQLISSVTGHQGHKRFKFGDRGRSCFSITIKPRLASIVQTTTPNQNAVMPLAGWQDCAFPSVKYYGLKLWFTDVFLPGGTVNNNGFRWKWTYNVSFKGSLNTF